ncbi:signal transduction histidine kinase [Brachybacterium muris]|uniref:histidine kinase n=1 Tax=Brachybacterium muris TaxID=219301 RepID=UPI0019589A5F|nr:signal transduction histidine kinase [Brachybacterium muris]MCT2177716.1 sensor histidine kinase [Brachybacterium muris]
MPSDMPDAPLIRRMLPPLQLVSLACLVLAAVGVLVSEPLWSPGQLQVAVVYAGMAPVIAMAWWMRARAGTARRRAILSAAVAIGLIPVAVSGSVGFTIPVLVLGVALLVVDVGRSAGAVAAAAVVITGTVLHGIGETGWVVGLLNSVPIAILLGFGIALGELFRAYHQAHHRDLRAIAERDEALDRLESALARLRRTAEIEKELLLADERARSARDLHDGLGHRLTLISMSLEFAGRARQNDPEAAWAEVAGADATAREALAEMRTWVRALSPVRDPDATGVAALEAIAESFRGTGLEVDVDAEGEEPELGQDASLLLYRAAQEGLTNALRHSRASRVRISVGIEGQDVVMRMINDIAPSLGHGVPVGAATAGFGLRGLAARAEALGGGVTAAREGDRFVLCVRIDRGRAAGFADGMAARSEEAAR